MSKENKKTNIERRELIKGLATVPVLGVFLVNVLRKIKRDTEKKANLLSNLIQENSPPAAVQASPVTTPASVALSASSE